MSVTLLSLASRTILLPGNSAITAHRTRCTEIGCQNRPVRLDQTPISDALRCSIQEMITAAVFACCNEELYHSNTDQSREKMPLIMILATNDRGLAPAKPLKRNNPQLLRPLRIHYPRIHPIILPQTKHGSPRIDTLLIFLSRVEGSKTPG